MNKCKLISTIVSIGIISTSLIASAALSSYASTGNNETIYKRGNQIIRTYTSTKSSNSSYLPINSTNTNQNSNTSSKNDATTTQRTRTYSNTNTLYNSNINETIYKRGSQIVRVYGSNSTSPNYSITSNNQTATNSNEASTEQKQSYSTNLTDSQIEILSLKMLTLINNERKENNLQTLEIDYKLSSLAQLKAEDMTQNNYLSHNSIKYGSIYSMISNAGIKYYNAGENIAKAFSIESAHNNFMNSALHRRAILASHFNHVGIGIAKQIGGMYKISVMFIEKK